MLDRLPIVLLFGLVGWCLGWLSAWLTDWLQSQDTSEGSIPPPPRRLLLRDPLVQGGSALVWAAAPVWLGGDWLRWTAAGLLAVPLIQVTVTDLRYRYVYTVVAAIGLVLGLALSWQLHGVEWWWSPAGAGGGFVAFGLIYLLGRVLYRGGEPLARGDITIAAMVGAIAAGCAAQALVLGVLLSGLFAFGVLIARRSRHEFLPYGPGLCLGGLATLFIC